MHALDYLSQLKGRDRARICLNAGLTPSYVNRVLATRQRANYVSLPLAVEVAKHSGGRVDVLGSIKPETVMDWSYLRSYLISRGI